MYIHIYTYIYIQGCANSLPQRQGTSKMYKKSAKNHPKIYHNPLKINQKSMKSGSWAPRGPKTSQDPSKPKNRSTFATNITTSPGTFWEAFPAMLASKSHEKATQKAYKILIDLEVHLSSIFHRFWEAFGSHVGLQDAL